jgi:hypothetical protein
MSIEYLLARMRQKQQIVEDMVRARLDLFKQYGGADGNDHNPVVFYDQLLDEHHQQIARNREYYLRLAALSFAAIEALLREEENVNSR